MQRSRMKSVMFSVFHLVNISTVRLGQWGSLLGVKTLQTITYQISFTNFARAIGVSSDLTIIAALQNESVLKFDAVFPSQSQITSFRWVAIGK